MVSERLIQDGPEVLGRLPLRGVSGQVDEPEALGHDQVGRGVPAGVIEPEPDEALASRPRLSGKQGQERGEERLGPPFDTDQKVSPVAGNTKAVTYSHL